MMQNKLIQIFWQQFDDDGNIDEDIVLKYVADLSTGKIYSDSDDDIGEIDDPYYFVAIGVGSFMDELLIEDESIITEPLSAKWIIEGIKHQISEPKLEDGIIRLGSWKRPIYGEFTLLFNVNSLMSNNIEDPKEWDMNISCIGVLDLNYELTEK